MRQDSKEIELKLAVAPADLAALKADRRFAELFDSPVRTERLLSVYFDTDRQDLYSQGMTLRLRRKGNDYLQTIKLTSSDGMIERDEWEHLVDGPEPDLMAASSTPVGHAFTPELRATLRPIFETRVQRTYYHLADSAWRIEIAFDQGEIVAGNRSESISEIELELKYGYRAALFELARMILEIIPARLTFVAKADRGFELTADNPHQFYTAHRSELAPGSRAAQSFQIITRGCLHQAIVNAPLVHYRNPEALHQLRIALRRLRTAISIYSDIVHDGQVERIKGELKWLNGELSAARDIDTLLEEVVKPLHRLHPGHRGLWSLHCSFARQRRRDYQRARQALQSLRFCRLLVETLAWIEIGEWVTTTDEAARLRREQPIEIYAAEQLAHRRRKIKKRGRKLDSLDSTRRHKLRIQVKKVRYATEFFADLFHERKSAKRSTKFLSTLKRLQSTLGGLNDVATRNALCAEILAKMDERPAPLRRDRAFAAGLIAGNQEAQQATLLSNAAKAHAQFEETKPFWK